MVIRSNANCKPGPTSSMITRRIGAVSSPNVAHPQPIRTIVLLFSDQFSQTDAPWQVHQEPNTAVAPTRPEITAAGTILTGGGERKSGRKKSKRSGRKAARTEREEELQRQRQETGSDGSRQAADVIEPEEFLMSGAYPPRTEPEPGPGPGKPAITAEGRLPGTHWPSV